MNVSLRPPDAERVNTDPPHKFLSRKDSPWAMQASLGPPDAERDSPWAMQASLGPPDAERVNTECVNPAPCQISPHTNSCLERISPGRWSPPPLPTLCSINALSPLRPTANAAYTLPQCTEPNVSLGQRALVSPGGSGFHCLWGMDAPRFCGARNSGGSLPMPVLCVRQHHLSLSSTALFPRCFTAA
ncbi:hypothetical protein B0H14DRAFT_3431361 [Mycena olivaceomarginata]|nr:hypothetical protein B0H14DRAFT_3431361 [Mycena olivaceomarginata]